MPAKNQRKPALIQGKATVSLALAVALAAMLMALTAHSLQAGPYLERKAEREIKALPVSVEAGVVGESATSLARDAALLLDANQPFKPTPTDIASLAASDDAWAFSLNPNTIHAPELSKEDAARIDEALSYFDNRGYRCSYLLVSLDTGRGVGGSYDTLVYGASTFKGILGAYICEELIDGGGLSISRVNNLMSSTIMASNNDTYRSLYNAYARSGIGISAWVESMGVSTANVCRYRFPTYSARESAALWTHIATYLESGSETATWLASLYEGTNVSHLRAAVERGVADGSLTCKDSWRVMNKAGWISGSTNSTSDAGIIEIDGHRYVMSIMTSAPDCAASREASTQLALALLLALV